MVKTSRRPANLSIRWVRLDRLLVFLAMVNTRDGTGRVSLEDTILRTPKDVAAVDDVTGDARHVEEEFGV